MNLEESGISVTDIGECVGIDVDYGNSEMESIAIAKKDIPAFVRQLLKAYNAPETEAA